MNTMRKLASLLLMGVWALPAAAASPEAAAPDFQRHVRPILSKFCFKCHGPDDQARKSGLRLDKRETALAPAKSGHRAIVPGQAGESELIRRVFASDPNDSMPPAEAKMSLSEDQKDILRRWVASGAAYAEH